MPSTNPKDILTTLHLIRAGLVSGLVPKEEVIDWADKIMTKDEQPDIFFIDLALSSSKSVNDIIHHFNNYLNFKTQLFMEGHCLGCFIKNTKVSILRWNKQ